MGNYLAPYLSYNTSPLRRAMLDNDVEEVRTILVQAGEGAPDLINEDYTSDCLYSASRNIQSPLHTAISRGRIEIAELLLQYGAEVNSPGLWGQTGLHLAAKQNNVAMCRLLILYGADFNQDDHDGRRAVHAAAMSCTGRDRQNVDALRYIHQELCRSEGIDVRDAFDRTPLHHAARFGYNTAVEYLIAMGADVNARNSRNKTPLEDAQLSDKFETARLIQKIAKQQADDALVSAAVARKAAERAGPSQEPMPSTSKADDIHLDEQHSSRTTAKESPSVTPVESPDSEENDLL